MLGLMQDWPLTLDRIFDHAKINYPNREIVTRSVEGPIVRTTYAQAYDRAKQVSNALKDSGIVLSDRIATLAWNSARHLEIWYGAMGVGAVVHTVNPRLFPEQIAWLLDHAEDKILFLDLTFVPMIEEIAPKLKTVRSFVILTDEANMPATSLPNAVAYEDFIAGKSIAVKWGGFDENTAAGLCYTSGTTGNPKGVLYSHRSNLLHALGANQGDAFGLRSRDVVLPLVPMFHANAWALAFIAPMAGAKLVMPGAKLDGPSVCELLETEGVTLSAAVPTVWLGLLNYLRESGRKLSTLKRIVNGGAALPELVLRTLEEEYGVEVIHAWGMTEMSPMGTLCTMGPEEEKLSHEEQIAIKLRQGRTPFTIEMKVVNDAGETLPRDGVSTGRLLVAGPAVAKAYFKNEGARREDGLALETCGFFDTGDIANINAAGYMQITDRAKDVIKSGGEFISSIDIENIAVGAEGVAVAAVIGMPHPKWDERPLLIVEAKPGANPTKDEILAYLNGKIVKWWTPDDVQFVEKIPLGATGKLNKLALREMFKGYKLPTA
ncbi:MAG: long-chain-fatty-acid--CoA ligase [Caulobacterales bacterium]